MKLDKLSIYENTLLLIKNPKKYFTALNREGLGSIFNRVFPIIIVVLVVQLLINRFSPLNKLAETQNPSFGLTILFALLGLAFSYIALPAVYNLVLRLFKSKKSFSDTIKVFLGLAYFGIISAISYVFFQGVFFFTVNSQVALLISILVWMLVALCLGVYSIYLMIKGISVIHKVSMGKSFVGLLLSGVVFFLLVIIISLMLVLVYFIV
jgi:hypothetical protein